MPHGITQCYLPPGRGDIPVLTPAEAVTRLSDPGRIQGVGLLHTEMVYPPEDGHPSRYKPGPTCVNFVHSTNAANHYATPPEQFCCFLPACVNLQVLISIVAYLSELKIN